MNETKSKILENLVAHTIVLGLLLVVLLPPTILALALAALIKYLAA